MVMREKDTAGITIGVSVLRRMQELKKKHGFSNYDELLITMLNCYDFNDHD
jgi:hypothetical protein